MTTDIRFALRKLRQSPGFTFVLLTVAVIASMLPATRAARVDVIEALRTE